MKNRNITLSELIREYKKRNSHYFDKDTLKHWGEKLSDMYILQKTVFIKDIRGQMHECIVLSKISKDFFGKPFRKYDYFDVNTLNRIIK